MAPVEQGLVWQNMPEALRIRLNLEGLQLPPMVGVGENNFLKTRQEMDREMGNKTEFETRNGKRDGIRDEKWA